MNPICEYIAFHFLNAVAEFWTICSRNCEDERNRSNALIAESQSAVQRFNSISNTLDTVSRELHGISNDCNGLRDKLQATTNRALDLSLLMSTISAQSQAMDVQDTAQKLAGAFMALDTIMDASANKDTALKQLYDAPDELELAVKAIAEADLPTVDEDF